MSYGRDRDAHHRGVGAVAAADHVRGRAVKRRQRARVLARRDAYLAGLTYGTNGGLAGYGALEQLGAFKTFGTPMQNPRDPGVRYGGGPDVPPPRPPPGGLPGTLTGGLPGTLGPRMPTNPPVIAPPLRPIGPLGTRPMPGGAIMPGPLRPITPGPTGVFGTSGGASGGTTTGGSSGGGDGSGAGIITGGTTDTPPMTPPPDVPDAPAADDSISIAGYAVPKTAVYVGGALLGAYLLFGRKR